MVAKNAPTLLNPFSLVHKKPFEPHETSLTARLLQMENTPESDACILSCLKNWLICAKSETGSLRCPAIRISQGSVHCCQTSDSESQTQKSGSISDSTAARPLTHVFFSTVVSLYFLSPTFHMSSIYVVGLTCDRPVTTDHGMGKKHGLWNYTVNSIHVAD